MEIIDLGFTGQKFTRTNKHKNKNIFLTVK